MWRRLRRTGKRGKGGGDDEGGAGRRNPDTSTPIGAQISNAGGRSSTASPPVAPSVDPLREDMNRRLSLDGDLPEGARRPDHRGADDDEGVVVVSSPNTFPVPIDVAGCSKAGWEPAKAMPGAPAPQALEVRKENQDAYCIYAPFQIDAAPGPNTSASSGVTQLFLGVFDGHGAEGRSIAHFVRDNVARLTRNTTLNVNSYAHRDVDDGHHGREPIISRDVHRARLDTLKSAFTRAERGLTDMENGIDHVFSGTTAVVSWMFNCDVYTAWAGDSRCIVGRAVSDDGRRRFRAVDLTHDQKPNRTDEKRRVKNAGGRIARWRRNMGPLRVWLPRDWIPGLAMTRSIGDTVLSEYGVSPVPEVTYTRLSSADAFMVLASDGVWEFMNSQEVVDFVGRMIAEGSDAAQVSEALVREAVRRWRRQEMVVDDTTAVVMRLNWGHEDANGISHDSAAASTHNKNKLTSHGGGTGRKKLVSRMRPGRRTAPANGIVSVVNDDGRLSEFVCKNDVVTNA